MDNAKKGYSDKQFFKPNTKSNLIKKMISDSSISQNDLADYLNCTISSLRNKFSRDSFSLYDFIVTCYVCGYKFSITTEMECDMNEIKECIEETYSKLSSFVLGDKDSDVVDEAYDTIGYAEEQFEIFETVFDFSPENILDDEECQRIQNIQKQKSNDKYHKILDSLSESEQLTMLELLKNKQSSTDSK